MQVITNFGVFLRYPVQINIQGSWNLKLLQYSWLILSHRNQNFSAHSAGPTVDGGNVAPPLRSLEAIR